MLDGIYAYRLKSSDVENVLVEVARQILGNPFSFYLELKDGGFKFRENLKDGVIEFRSDELFLNHIMEDSSCPTLQQYVKDHHAKSIFPVYHDMVRIFLRSCRFIIDLESNAMADMITGKFIENPVKSVFRLTDSNDLLASVRLWPENGISPKQVSCKGEIKMPFLGTAEISSISFAKINMKAAENNGLGQGHFLDVAVNLPNEDNAIITMMLNYLKEDR